MCLTLSERCKTSHLQSTYSTPTSQSFQSSARSQPASAHFSVIAFNPAPNMSQLHFTYSRHKDAAKAVFLATSAFWQLAEPLQAGCLELTGPKSTRPAEPSQHCDSSRWHPPASPVSMPTCSPPFFSVSLPYHSPLSIQLVLLPLSHLIQNQGALLIHYLLQDLYTQLSPSTRSPLCPLLLKCSRFPDWWKDIWQAPHFTVACQLLCRAEFQDSVQWSPVVHVCGLLMRKTRRKKKIR